MNKFCLTFVFLCGLFLNNLFSQSSKADSLFYFQEYEKAIIQYERNIFFSSNEDSISEYLLKKSYAYKALSQYDKAITTLERINFQTLNDSMNFMVYYEMATNAFLFGRFNEAISFCDMLLHYHSQSGFPLENIYLILALSNIELMKYDESLKYSQLLIDSSNRMKNEKDSLKKVINILFLPENLPSFKKPEKAELLSAILPGLGQCYSGYYLEGIASLTTHLVLLGLTGFAVYKSYYLTAYFGGVSMFMRFYFGGSRRSEFLAHKRNEKLKNDFKTQIRKVLIK